MLIRSVSVLNCLMKAVRSITFWHISFYNDLNMTKIESRPLPEKNWEYRFSWILGNLNDSAVKNALRGLSRKQSALRVFGNYR